MLSSCESEIPPAPIVAWRNGASCLGSKGEKDGREYHFLTEDDFTNKIKSEEFALI